jgi:hypothetical protein
VKPGLDFTTEDEADVRVEASITDVLAVQQSLADYTGELRVSMTLRATDRSNGSSSTEPATVDDFAFNFTMPCTATAGTAGSTCSITTTADTLIPGWVSEGRRTIWQFGGVSVLDGGADGVAHTGPNTLFARQGLFVP